MEALAFGLSRVIRSFYWLEKMSNAYIKREKEEGEAEGIKENTHVRNDILEGLEDPGNL